MKILNKYSHQISIFKKFLKEELRFFLILISFASIFSRSSECGYLEKTIEKCKTNKEVVEISENFIKKMKELKEIKEENSSAFSEGEYLTLEDSKKEYLKKINNLIETKEINVKELDIELNWKERTWRERNNFKSLVFDPRRKLIINPLNLISNIFKNKIKHFFNNDRHRFIIDITTKLIVCNLITFLITKKNNEINNNLRSEEETLEDLKRGIGDFFISALFAILSSHAFFTNEKNPSFIQRISKFNWIISVIIINNFIPYIIKNLKNEEKSNFSQFITELIISIYALNSISGGQNSFFLYSIINSIISTTLYNISNSLNQIKQRRLSIIEEEYQETEL